LGLDIAGGAVGRGVSQHASCGTAGKSADRMTTMRKTIALVVIVVVVLLVVAQFGPSVLFGR
jgi:hypothetical protein